MMITDTTNTNGGYYLKLMRHIAPTQNFNSKNKTIKKFDCNYKNCLNYNVYHLSIIDENNNNSTIIDDKTMS